LMAASVWHNILETTQELGYGERAIFMVGNYLIHNVTFWILNGFLFLCYKWDLFPKYRINPASKYPDAALIRECMKMILINQFILQMPLSYLLFPLLKARGLDFSPELPSPLTVIAHILIFMICEDTMFYWSHRMLHHPAIYKHIHKKHHEFKTTIGIASEYAHTVEWFVSNLMPFMMGPLLIGPHMVTLWIWMFIRVVETVEAHSGCTVPFSPFNFLPFQGGAERHDYHHMYNVGSFGSFFNYWDKIMGTDASFSDHLTRLKNGSKVKKG